MRLNAAQGWGHALPIALSQRLPSRGAMAVVGHVVPQEGRVSTQQTRHPPMDLERGHSCMYEGMYEGTPHAHSPVAEDSDLDALIREPRSHRMQGGDQLVAWKRRRGQPRCRGVHSGTTAVR